MTLDKTHKQSIIKTHRPGKRGKYSYFTLRVSDAKMREMGFQDGDGVLLELYKLNAKDEPRKEDAT